jgi:hypothetical protein
MAPQTADKNNMLGNMLSNYTLKCENHIFCKKCLRMYPPIFQEYPPNNPKTLNMFSVKKRRKE